MRATYTRNDDDCFGTFTHAQSPLPGASTSSREAADKTLPPSDVQTPTVRSMASMQAHDTPSHLRNATTSRLQGASSQVIHLVEDSDDDLDDFEPVRVCRRLPQSTGGHSASYTVAHMVSFS